MFDTIKKANFKLSQYGKKYLLKHSTSLGLFYSNGRKNLGDSVTPWLIEKVAGKKIEYTNPLECTGPQLLAIGSILEFATADCTIWGSGFIKKNGRPKSEPEKVIAVRGPLTAERFINLGLKTTNLYGDPALALPLYAKMECKFSANKIGLIPHYIDKPNLLRSKIIRSSNAKFIDIETDDIYEFLRAISDCEVIVSSSLHGLIIAEAYGIPAIWAEFDDSVVGGHFKFNDYFLSTGRKIAPKNFYSIDEFEVARGLKAPPLLNKMTEDLINEFPSAFKA